jgi:tetratricopeptide (TPR) repeat protein
MQESLKAFSQAITLGKYKEAQTILDSHKQDIAKYFPDNHPAAFSEFSQAKTMFKHVYENYSKIYGENHTSTVNCLINLATIHKDLQEHDLAVPLYEKAIEARKVLEGEDSVNYAMVKAMASGAYRELGKYEIAD